MFGRCTQHSLWVRDTGEYWYSYAQHPYSRLARLYEIAADIDVPF